MNKKITFLFFLLAIPFTLFSQHPHSSPDFEEVDTYLQKAVKDFGSVGLNVVVFKDTGIVFEQSYGYKNAAKRIPLNSTSLFNIASCSKAFTAACLAMLVEQGKLKWEDKVVDYLPEFKLADPWITENLNIVDILSHRSGLSTYTGDLLWYETDYSKEEIIHRLRYLPIENDFRAQYGYQNTMYIVAGEIIEKVSGMPWNEFVQKNIFNPLGMEQSRPSSSELGEDQDIALPHLEGEPQALYITDANPAASIYSSVDELAHWVGMLSNKGMWQGDTIMSPQVMKALFTPRTIQRVSGFYQRLGIHFRSYGLGWNLFDFEGKMVAEHGGGMPGYLSKVVIVPEEKLGFVILTNDMNSLYSALVYYFLELYLKGEPQDWAATFLKYKAQGEAYEARQTEKRNAERVEDTSPSLAPEEYVGTYRDRYYGDAEVSYEGDELRLTLLPTRQKFTSKMDHWHYDTYRIKFVDEFLPQGFVSFSLDSHGEVKGFKIDLPNPDFHFYKLDFKKL